MKSFNNPLSTVKHFLVEFASGLTRQKKIPAQENLMEIDNENIVALSSQLINKHIESYLDYYCGLADKPGFAVLLKGEWGTGKTWFVERYKAKLDKSGKKCLYVSLYGMTSFSDIEDALFQQLHPVLSSQGVVIAGKIVTTLVKGSLKLDLNNDKRDDGTWNAQVPEIKIPTYLKKTNEHILIFDDLERSQIDIENILGYINQFVEHQGLKVILVANEEVLNKHEKYKSIKEKLIGRAFNVFPDFERASESFIAGLKNLQAGKFLSENIEVIQDLYKRAEYENLRNLKQIFLDFERIFNSLPDKVKNKAEALQDVLVSLMLFSIEIKRDAMSPEDIEKLEEEYNSGVRKTLGRNSASALESDGSEENLSSLQKIVNRYREFNIHNPFPSKLWWQLFFGKGFIDIKELDVSILSSKHFKDKSIPDWIQLWHYSEMSDDEFEAVLKKVELQYEAKDFIEIGEIKHVVGLLLTFSAANLYKESEQEILNKAKLYIDYLGDNDLLPLPSTYEAYGSSDAYLSLMFQGRYFQEFKELTSYIKEAQERSKIKNISKSTEALLLAMQGELRQFAKMLCMAHFQNEDSSVHYHDFPILLYIRPEDFFKRVLLLESRNKEYVFWVLKERYRYSNFNEELIKELEWMKFLQALVLRESKNRQGKLSGFVLNSFNENYLTEIIKKIEKRAKEVFGK